MRKTALLARVVLSCSVLAVGVGMAMLGIHPDQGPVYTVAQVQAGLAHHPQAWVGRTVRMRGVAWRCLGWAYGPCLIPSPILTDPGAYTGLGLTRRTATPLLAFVHALPLVDRLVPLEQASRWGVLASYRVQIRAVPIAACVYWPCYEALLLDAAP
jgi:hypothetical protein